MQLLDVQAAQIFNSRQEEHQVNQIMGAVKDLKTYAILFFLFLALTSMCLWRCDRPMATVQKSTIDSLKGVIRTKDNEIAILRAKISRRVVKHEEIKKEATRLPRIKEVPKTPGDSVLRYVATEKERLLDRSLVNFDSTFELVRVEHKTQDLKDSLVRRVLTVDSTLIKAQAKDIAALNKKVSRRNFWLKIETIAVIMLGGLLVVASR